MSDGRRLETARIAVAQGSDVALALFRAALALETKSNTTDWVTRADREAEAAVLDVIRDRHLGEVTVAEEADGPTAVPDSGPAWIVDPIDGTNNYVRGIRNWATSVAAVVDGEPVAAVNTCSTLGGTYVADEDGADQNGVELSARERDQPATFAVSPTIWWKPNRRDEYAKATRETVERFGGLARFRCVQLTLSLIESGTLDGAIMNVRTNPWDSVAGVHLVKSAGGRVTDLTGKPWRAARPESSRRRRDRVPRGSVPSSRRDRVRRPASLLQDRVSHGRLLRTVSNDHRRPRQS